MEPDYERDGKALLLRAMTAIVERMEDRESDGYGDGVCYLVDIYRALACSQRDTQKDAKEAIADGVSEALTKAIMADLGM